MHDDEARAERDRLRALLESPAYVRADRDVDFLQRDDLRSVRLGLEYLKAELSLREQGVESVIVLFGGTRIVEPESARRRVELLRAEVEAHPEDIRRRRSLAVAERILAKSHYYDVARDFARMVSEYCRDRAPCELVVMTGGGPGIMEAGNRGAFDAGRVSIGLNIQLPLEQVPNPYITPELCFEFRYFALRKMHFMMRARALVAFPGGYGTFDELFDALCLVQTGKMEAIPIILVGESFWRRAFDAEFLRDEGVIADKDVEIFRYAETAEEIWGHIASHYGMEPLGAGKGV